MCRKREHKALTEVIMDEGIRLSDKYAHIFKDLLAAARKENVIDETNIYQEANPKILPFLLRPCSPTCACTPSFPFLMA